MARITKTSVEINLADLDQDDLRSYVQENNYPSEVFPESEMDEWAKDNDYIKNPEVQ